MNETNYMKTFHSVHDKLYIISHCVFNITHCRLQLSDSSTMSVCNGELSLQELDSDSSHLLGPRYEEWQQQEKREGQEKRVG